MKLFRKLFAEKILRYYEGTEAGIKMIKSFPVIRKLVKDDAFGEKSKSRAIVGTMAQIFMLAWEFIRKFMYVILLIYVPYTILAFLPTNKDSSGYFYNISVYNAFNYMWKSC